MNTTPSPAAASPREQATACVLTDADVALLERAANVLACVYANEDSDAVAMRALAKRLRAGGSASLWRPIDSAPRDDSFIGWMPGWRTGAEVHWCDDGACHGGWYLANNDPTDSWGPGALPLTMWQPLPHSPATAASAATEGEE